MSDLVTTAVLSMAVTLAHGQKGAVEGPPDPRADLEAMLERFWTAGDAEGRDAVAREIVASGAPFDDVFAGLRRGRSYARDAPRGRLLFEHTVHGIRHPYMVLVPEDYTPERRWPVRFDLHGGMGADEWVALDGAWSPGWRSARDQIVVVPAGWWDSMWWERSQLDNFEAILRFVRATWNVDEDRVVAYGGSDGGRGALLPWRCVGPTVGRDTPGTWRRRTASSAPSSDPDGQMHLSNLAGQRFHLGFGELDPKVPLRHLRRYMELFERHAELDWYVLPGQGHALSIPRERERELGRFLWNTVRDPFPDRVSWATESTDRYARRSWLVIEELGLPEGVEVDRSNVLPRWGTPIQLRGPTVPRRPWGRVELQRDGNRVRATTVHVARFKLLLAPEEFDLDRPVVVEVDGRIAFEGRVEPSVATLLERAARDDERRVLFAAEITIDV